MHEFERVPLWDAAGLLAKRLNIARKKGLDTIVQAGATKRIKIFATPTDPRLGDRIRARVCRRILRGEAALSAEPRALRNNARRLYPTGPEVGGGVLWDDPYVFRGDLERLIRELASGSGNAETKSAAAEPAAGTKRQAEPAGDTARATDDGDSKAPRDTVALRGKAKERLATYIDSGEHQNRDATLSVMRAAHPGLAVRGSVAVWRKFTKENPDLRLSRPGAKLKRNTNN